jgi:hypothetical protein
MDISKEASEIINQARLYPYDEETIVALIKKHGVDAAAEAITTLARVIPQGTSCVPFVSKR